MTILNVFQVVLIIGISGGLRREDLYKLVVQDVEIKNDLIIINVPVRRTRICRQFVITNSKWISLVQKYMQIRLTVSKIKDNFFLKYQKGRCISLPVGINTIGSIPSKIAKFLNLENYKEYTGHCYRQTATLLANQSNNLLTSKKQAGWKESWEKMEDSLKRKVDVALKSEAEPCTSKILKKET